ncbi:hypothetical protein NE237_002230 [Protea cynaroides]|uniref:Uncharacterized protein n=1 Tax=Protea cynaroides TaxID=273540 RepID=A0A9Q0KVQ6_9MAGN|nr:hypothetical protein NE237_002230 [Protea cynaroides]
MPSSTKRFYNSNGQEVFSDDTIDGVSLLIGLLLLTTPPEGESQGVPNLPPPLAVNTSDDMIAKIRDLEYTLEASLDPQDLSTSPLITSPEGITAVLKGMALAMCQGKCTTQKSQHLDKEEHPREVSETYQEFVIKGDPYTGWGHHNQAPTLVQPLNTTDVCKEVIS